MASRPVSYTHLVPKPEYEGWVTNDDFVFAINLTPGEGQTKETEYGVVQMGIEGLDACLLYTSRCV